MVDARKVRSRLYRKVHGKPAQVFEAEDGGVVIEAYAFDFSPGEDEDLGWVLFTNGMSDRCMPLDEAAAEGFARGEVKRRAELVWYVRDLDRRWVDELRWLAEYPFLDETWLGHGHTIAMPDPIVPGTVLTAFLLLGPILRPHQRIAEALSVAGDPVELLVVHLLTTQEHALKKREGVNALLDLFDARAYPLVLDPQRASLV